MAIRDLVGSAVVAAVVAAGTAYALHHSLLQNQAIEVPSVLGLPVQSARALIENRGLMFVVSEEREDVQTPAGNILQQRPLQGSRIDRGQAVDVVVAKAPAPIKMPSLVGLALAEAKLQLASAKLVLGKVSEDTSPKVKLGSIISQSIAEGGETRAGATVDLVVSKGPPMVAVPSVLGRSLAHAKEELQKAGLAVGNLRWREDEDRSEGVVLEQNPAAEQQAAKGAAVDLVVNRF
jgi:beta-lactam-binding protein with PASTA domain